MVDDLNPNEPPPALPPSGGMNPSEEKNWCVGAHLAAALGFVIPPIGQILGPLIVWLFKKEQSPLIAEHARVALNFQITMTICAAACVPLIWLFGLGALLMAIISIFNIVNVIMSSIAASEGRLRPYPYSLKLIS